jgi:hypothetical protein
VNFGMILPRRTEVFPEVTEILLLCFFVRIANWELTVLYSDAVC